MVSNPARRQEPCVPLYRAAPAAVQSGARADQPAARVACRCLLLTVLVTAASRARPRRRETAAMEPAPRLPRSQAGMGGRRLQRRTHHLGQDSSQAHPKRQAARRPAHLSCPAAGSSSATGLDHPVPPDRPRLRATAAQHLLVNDHHHDPAPSPETRGRQHCARAAGRLSLRHALRDAGRPLQEAALRCC